jgi:hypothetical protein
MEQYDDLLLNFGNNYYEVEDPFIGHRRRGHSGCFLSQSQGVAVMLSLD